MLLVVLVGLVVLFLRGVEAVEQADFGLVPVAVGVEVVEGEEGEGVE